MGNFFIGGIEAWVISRVLGRGVVVPLLKTKAISANYFSAFVGGALLIWGLSVLPVAQRGAIDHPRVTLWGTVVLAYVVSVLMEWPVLRWRTGVGMFRAVAVANLVSYALLVPFFWYLPMNNLGEWRLPPRGEHPVVAGNRLVFLGRDGGERVVDLGPVSATRPFQEVDGSGIGVAKRWDPEGQESSITTWDEKHEWSMGGHGFGYTYMRSPRDSKIPNRQLLTESAYMSDWVHDMVCVKGRYLACVLGPYVALVDPETRTIYRVAEGSKLRVRVSGPPTSRAGQPVK